MQFLFFKNAILAILFNLKNNLFVFPLVFVSASCLFHVL